MFQKKPWHSRAKSPARKTKLDVVKMSNYQRKLRGKPQVNIRRGRRDVYVCVGVWGRVCVCGVVGVGLCVLLWCCGLCWLVCVCVCVWVGVCVCVCVWVCVLVRSWSPVHSVVS